MLIELEEDISGYTLPGGASAQVAVYTDEFSHVAIIRKVLLRMQSWLHYVAFDH